MGCLHCDVPVPEVHTLCCSLAKLAIGCSQSNSLVSACRLSASLINKIPEGMFAFVYIMNPPQIECLIVLVMRSI